MHQGLVIKFVFMFVLCLFFVCFLFICLLCLIIFFFFGYSLQKAAKRTSKEHGNYLNSEPEFTELPNLHKMSLTIKCEIIGDNETNRLVQLSSEVEDLFCNPLTFTKIYY